MHKEEIMLLLFLLLLLSLVVSVALSRVGQSLTHSEKENVEICDGKKGRREKEKTHISMLREKHAPSNRSQRMLLCKRDSVELWTAVDTHTCESVF